MDNKSIRSKYWKQQFKYEWKKKASSIYHPQTAHSNLNSSQLLFKSQFWLSVKSEYPLLSEKAMEILIKFSTTYLCEKIFSSVTAIKTRYRSTFEINRALRLAVTSLEPKMHKLIQNKQEQISH